MTKRANPLATAQAKLDAVGVDAFCDRIIDGETYTAIAADLGISIASLCNWVAGDPERSARAREARIASAQSIEERAERDIQDAADPFELMKAKELGYHRRWKASKINPRDYGDKLQVDQTTKFENLPEDAIAARLALIQKQMADAQPVTGEAQHEGGA